ncbi:MAG TPA: ABC transporter ATP-binding protein [Xanthobacteraceae bacterium]|nr:ABC transporter ATP-binding protein [Xanthobacteraceae bacterium]
MAMLETHDLTAFYGDFQALFGITFTLGEGETVAIIGANGAGKSTFLKAVAGLLPRPARAVRFDNRDIGALPAYDIVKLGIALVPEGRRLFSSLSVEENLLVGAYGRHTDGPWDLPAIYRLFPALRERRNAPSTALSGGQQQMVAIGRSLMSNPRVLLCDELSLGLAPIIIRDIYAALADIKQRGTSVVLVEQDLLHAMSVADRAYCFQEGRVSLTGRPQDLSRDAIHAAYFGL